LNSGSKCQTQLSFMTGLTMPFLKIIVLLFYSFVVIADEVYNSQIEGSIQIGGQDIDYFAHVENDEKDVEDKKYAAKSFFVLDPDNPSDIKEHWDGSVYLMVNLVLSSDFVKRKTINDVIIRGGDSYCPLKEIADSRVSYLGLNNFKLELSQNSKEFLEPYKDENRDYGIKFKPREYFGDFNGRVTVQFVTHKDDKDGRKKLQHLSENIDAISLNATTEREMTTAEKDSYLGNVTNVVKEFFERDLSGAGGNPLINSSTEKIVITRKELDTLDRKMSAAFNSRTICQSAYCKEKKDIHESLVRLLEQQKITLDWDKTTIGGEMIGFDRQDLSPDAIKEYERLVKEANEYNEELDLYKKKNKGFGVKLGEKKGDSAKTKQAAYKRQEQTTIDHSINSKIDTEDKTIIKGDLIAPKPLDIYLVDLTNLRTNFTSKVEQINIDKKVVVERVSISLKRTINLSDETNLLAQANKKVNAICGCLGLDSLVRQTVHLPYPSESYQGVIAGGKVPMSAKYHHETTFKDLTIPSSCDSIQVEYECKAIREYMWINEHNSGSQTNVAPGFVVVGIDQNEAFDNGKIVFTNSISNPLGTTEGFLRTFQNGQLYQLGLGCGAGLEGAVRQLNGKVFR